VQFSTYNLKKTEELIKEAGYQLRYEKGQFNSGFCILQDKKVVVINKYFTPEVRFSKLIDIIATIDFDRAQIQSEQGRKALHKIDLLFAHANEMNFDNTKPTE
jgi:hypothetical protein